MPDHWTEQVKTVLVRLAAATARGTIRLSHRLSLWWPKLQPAARALGGFFLSLAILPGYKSYLQIKKVLKKFYAPHKRRHRIVHPFVRRYLVHVFIILLGLFTIGANFNTRETQRDGQTSQSIIAALVTTDNLGEIDEEGPIQGNQYSSRYLEVSGVQRRVSLIQTNDSEGDLVPMVAGQGAVVRPILSPTEQQTQRRDKIITYTVALGDTVSGIASKFGISVNTLLWENNLTAYSLIRPGNTLTILPTTGIRHKVAKGESLAKIAKDYGVDAESIIDANRLASANDLRLGEQLMIPNGKKPYTPPAYTARQPFYQPPGATALPATTVVGTGRMVWPNGCRRVSQYFSWRHTGVDIACPMRSNVVAADAGQVITAQGGYNGGYGNYVIINHRNGLQTLYAHLSVINVSVGENVAQGQLIGLEGSTGRSTGPHLHFEIRSGGVRRNPLQYIR